MSPTAGLVRAGSWGAAALSAHTVVNTFLLRTPTGDPPPTSRRVSVCIPMRDEEDNARGCLDAVLATTGVHNLEVLVLDDASSDTTAELVGTVVQGDPRVRLIAGEPLPAGWLGKPHACAQLGERATGDILVFLDADVRIAPHAIAAGVEMLEATHLAMVSPYPRQLAASFAERLMQPLLQWSWLTFVPLRLAESVRPASLTAANGQFLLIDRHAYRSIGGHTAVRDHVIEDVWLARAMKRAGHRVSVVDGTHLAECRMYRGWGELRDGYTKSLWAAFGSPMGAVGAIALLGLCFVVPPVAAVVGPRRIGLFGTAASIMGRATAARRTGGRTADAWMHPGSIAALGYLTVKSVLGHRRGTLLWKGRPLRAFGPT